MNKFRTPILILSFIAVGALLACGKTDIQDFDFLIKNGRIVDGTGNPWFYGDVGIRGDTIVEVGNLSEKSAVHIIDATGKIVSPGFIDIHTHCDTGLGEPESNANFNYLTQGVTTVVTGNCGQSVALNASETKKKWETLGIGTNAILLAGHGNIRRAVMGEQPNKPTLEQMEQMKNLLRQAMKEGAWGMSTGLEYIPGRYAETEELIDLAKIVGEFGGIYSTHKRSEREYVREAVKETLRIGKEANVRVNISHLKLCGTNFWGQMKDVIKLINEARAEGISATADMYPYNRASSGPLGSFLSVPEGMEPMASLRKEMRKKNLSNEEGERLARSYIDELKKALSDDSKCALIREATVVGFPNRPSVFARTGWDSFSVVQAKKNIHLIDKVIFELAKEQNKDPFDILKNLFLEEGNDVLLSTGVMSEDDMKLAMKESWLMFSSDGQALVFHPESPVTPRNYGSFPRVLRKYVREEGVLTLEDGVRKMTSLPASLLQLKHRGLLAPGYKADVVIFDPVTIRDNSTFIDSHRPSSGIEYVLVNGRTTIENGEYNKELNGKLLLMTENR